MSTSSSPDNMVFRSVSVDPDVDSALRKQADQAGVSKGEMYRRYLSAGMRNTPKGETLAALERDNAPLALRTIYLPVDVDESLRVQAFTLRTSKSNLMREFLRMGMKALQATLPAAPIAFRNPAKKAAAKAAAKKPAPADKKPAVKPPAKAAAPARKPAAKKAAAKGPAKTTTSPRKTTARKQARTAKSRVAAHA